MKKSSFVTSVIILITFFNALTYGQDIPEKWEAPEEYQNMKNSFGTDSEALSNGKMLYNMHCRLCHGKKGLGDGPGGKDLDTRVPDLNSDDVVSQPEGVLFYKITIGRGDMPEYKNKIPDEEDRWNLVSYLQDTFGD